VIGQQRALMSSSGTSQEINNFKKQASRRSN